MAVVDPAAPAAARGDRPGASHQIVAPAAASAAVADPTAALATDDGMAASRGGSDVATGCPGGVLGRDVVASDGWGVVRL